MRHLHRAGSVLLLRLALAIPPLALRADACAKTAEKARLIPGPLRILGPERLARRPGILLATALLAAGAVAGHAQQSRAQQGGTGAPPAEAVHLVAASSNNFPPVNVLDADGDLTGFGRELAEAVVEAAGATVTNIHSEVWTEVLDWLDRGEADFIHDTGYTEERTSYLDYTAPILEMPERIFVLADRSDIESFADLAGKKVACVNQHITHLYLKQFPEIDCLIVKRPMEGLYALVEGEAAAFIYPKQIALYLAHNTRLRNRVKMVGEPLRTLTWHMAVKKGNAPLVELLDRGIAKVRANGQYDRIYAKWFGEPLLAGYTQREVTLFVCAAIGLSMLAAGAVFLLLFAGRMRTAAKVEEQPIKPGLIAFAAVMTVAIFLVDVSLPLGVAGGVPYAAVVFFGWWLDRPRFIFSLALVGSALTVAGYLLSPEGGPPWMVVTNRFLALSVIWVTALLLVKAKHAEAGLRYAHSDLERQVEARTNDIRTANEALRESEEQFRATFEQAAVGIGHVAPDSRFLRVNQKLCDIVGYGQDELLEKSFQDISHPDDLDANLDYLNQALAGEISAYSMEKRYFRKDGSTIWINLTVSLLRRASGAPNYLIAVSEDITDRKRAEAALVESEASLANAQRIAHLGAWDWDIVSNEIAWSDEIYRIFGLRPQEFGATYEAFLQSVHPEDRGSVQEAVDAALHKNAPYSIDYRIVLPGGGVRVVHEQAEVPFGEAGQPIRMSGTVQDITERKLAEEDRERLATAVENLSETVALLDAEDRFVLCNRAFREVNQAVVEAFQPGKRFEDFLRAALQEGLIPEAIDREDEWLKERLERHYNPRGPFEIMRQDGLCILLHEQRLSDGSIISFGMDVTERMRAEAALRESEEQVRLLMNSTAEAIYGLNLEGNCSFANPACAEMLGYGSPEDLLGKHMHDLIHHTRRDGTRYPIEECLIYQAFVRGEGTHVEDEVLWRRDGTSFPAEYWSHPVRRDGEVVGTVVTFLDITERKRAETALHRLGIAVEGASEIIALYDAEDRLILFNRAYSEMNCGGEKPITLGMMFEEQLRTIVANGLVPEAAGREEAWLCERLERHRNPGDRVEVARQNGIWLLTHEQRLPDGGTITVSLDITERKRADAALRASEARLAGILDIAPEAVISIDAGGRIQLFNQGAEALFGYRSEEIMGQPLELLLPPHIRAHHAKFVAGFARAQEASRRMGRRREIAALRKDGTEFPAEGSISKLGVGEEMLFTVVLRDLTEQRRAEELLRQAQKMEAVGRLTGGVAHDFNNLLGVILGNAEMLSDQIGQENEYIQRMMRAALRGAELTNRLLAFSRQQPLQSMAIDVGDLVVGMMDMLRRSLGETIDIKCVVGKDLWTATVDPGLLENALLNLAINARDAMSGAGALVIETANAVLEESYAATRTDVVAGDYVMLAVTDTGTGMAPEVLEHVFEPFFTTKDIGKGTGLGLSMVFGFAKQSGGHVAVYSEQGKGATVKLYLPRTMAPAERPKAPVREDMPGGRGETVLVVEDDGDVRELAVLLLEGLGYQVLEARDGKSGLAVLEQSPGVDLLLTDMVLAGGMSGWDLADEATRRDGGLKILFMSGYTDNAAQSNGCVGKGVDMLQKPFPKRDLATKVRSALDRAVD